ncbi:MAG: hypothetical protein WC516_07245 [Patescibacteria group bacterium]
MSKKSEKPKCKVCGLETEVIFEGKGAKYPVFSCPKCGYGTNEWEKWWEMYSTRWKEKEYWKNIKDKPSCLIGYFCYKFNEFYEYPYTFDVSNPIPYKGKEFTMARRIIAMFDDDARDAATYIKWVFAKKVRSRKKPITSLGFFTLSEFINEYKYAKAQNQLLRRQTPLPQDYLEWCKSECPALFETHDFKTWNDLNGLISFIKTYKTADLEKKVVMEAVNRKMIIIINNELEFKKLED